MTTKRKRKTLVRRPRNLVCVDGLPWIKRGGRLWGPYKVCAEYIGVSPNSFATYVYRHNLKTIKHGRRSLVSKEELDNVTGAAAVSDV